MSDLEVAAKIAISTPYTVNEVHGIVRAAVYYGMTLEQCLAFGGNIFAAVHGLHCGFSVEEMLSVPSDQLSSAVALAGSVLSFARFIDVDIEKLKQEIRLAHLTV